MIVYTHCNVRLALLEMITASCDECCKQVKLMMVYLKIYHFRNSNIAILYVKHHFDQNKEHYTNNVIEFF